ncbi:MAG: DUF4249 domain-containing protein [Bacteroidota bacterium]
MHKLIAIYKFLPAMILLAMLLTACIDEVDFPIDREEPLVFVDGMISDSLDTYTIRLGYSAELGEGNDNILIPIADAEVTVQDEQGNLVAFIPDGNGLYQATMAGVPGRAYQLKARLAGGREIESEMEVLPPSIPISSLKAEVEVEEFLNTFNNLSIRESLVLRASSDIPSGERPYLRWQVRGEYEFREGYPGALSTKWCYIPDKVDINQLNIFDSRLLAGDELREQEILTTDYNYRFAYMYCFHVQQLRISEKEFNYWSQIALLLNRSGSLFDPPPGNIRGNMYDAQDDSKAVLGFFSVAGASYKRQFISRDTTNIYIDDRCRFQFNVPTPQACIDCLTLDGSKVERPDYWIP